MSEQCDIAIIGAGAAGLAAGIFAAEAARDADAKPRIIVLDGAKIIGAKILVSGGGRCNVTHDQISSEDYFGSRTIVRNILAAFDAKATLHWMQALGVPLKREETGKLFPVSDSARTVLEALLRRLEARSVEVQSDCRVTEIHRIETGILAPSPGTPGGGWGEGLQPTGAESHHFSPLPARRERESDPFLITHGSGSLAARRVIFCTGGRSLPRTGSDGAGWNIVRQLGHQVTDTYPALVPLVLDDKMFHAEVSGLSHEAELSTFVEGKRVDRRSGSLLWTHFGISGPVAMDASRFWVMAHAKGQPAELRCNFLPGESFETTEKALLTLAGPRPRLSIAKAVAQRLPERLRLALMQWVGIDATQPIAQLSRESRRKLIHALTALPLPVLRDRGWNYAEVTAGGVPLDEIDFRTMASRKVPGLYLAGEVLDCDGRIGGFNFQWAWATGYLAGRAATRSLTCSTGATQTD